MGNDNFVTRVTVRRFGECGILTSQRSNEISYSHVHDGGLTGLDSAGIHADNTFVSCMNWSLPLSARANCTKVWHHNWVHDCMEKCVRGDDRNLNLTIHHNVIFNCGVPPFTDRNDPHASTGVILKGDYNAYWANTVFNSAAAGQGDLCAVTSPLHSGYVRFELGCPPDLCSRSPAFLHPHFPAHPSPSICLPACPSARQSAPSLLSIYPSTCLLPCLPVYSPAVYLQLGPFYACQYRWPTGCSRV